MIANLTPFRGPAPILVRFMRSASCAHSADPVFGYATTACRSPSAPSTCHGRGTVPRGIVRDAEGMLIEQFGLFDNLMIEGGDLGGGGCCRRGFSAAGHAGPICACSSAARCRVPRLAVGCELRRSRAAGPSAAAMPNSAGQRALREQPGDVAHLAPGPRLRLAVEMRDQPGRRQHRRPQRHLLRADQVLHDRVGMARPPAAAAGPAMARICSSNWLAGQASIVQWPELCGRGAISLTSTRPSRRRTSRPRAPRPDRARRRSAGRSPGPARSTAVGIRRRGKRQVEDVVAVAVLHGVESRIRAVRAARDDHADLLRRNRRSLPGSAASATRRANAGGKVRRARAASPGPCRHSRAGWSSAPPAGRCGRPPRRSPSRSPTGAQGAVGTPAAFRKPFSGTRSWLIRSIVGRRAAPASATPADQALRR